MKDEEKIKPLENCLITGFPLVGLVEQVNLGSGFDIYGYSIEVNGSLIKVRACYELFMELASPSSGLSKTMNYYRHIINRKLTEVNFEPLGKLVFRSSEFINLNNLSNHVKLADFITEISFEGQ